MVKNQTRKRNSEKRSIRIMKQSVVTTGASELDAGSKIKLKAGMDIPLKNNLVWRLAKFLENGMCLLQRKVSRKKFLKLKMHTDEVIAAIKNAAQKITARIKKRVPNSAYRKTGNERAPRAIVRHNPSVIPTGISFASA